MNITDEPGDAEPWHGTQSGYTNHGCRCAACRKAHAKAARKQRERLAATTPFDKIPHGVNGYVNYGCKCAECRAAGAARRGGTSAAGKAGAS